jgi:hypothetical protein
MHCQALRKASAFFPKVAQWVEQLFVAIGGAGSGQAVVSTGLFGTVVAPP